DLDHKRDKTPRLCVPETSGTDEAHAARQDPCLAKTRRILHLISQFRSRPDRLGCGESNIMKPSPGGCKGYLHLSASGRSNEGSRPAPPCFAGRLESERRPSLRDSSRSGRSRSLAAPGWIP